MQRLNQCTSLYELLGNEKALCIESARYESNYVLGTSECQYGEEGPSEDKTSLGESKAERWKEDEAGRRRRQRDSIDYTGLRCEQERKFPGEATDILELFSS